MKERATTRILVGTMLLGLTGNVCLRAQQLEQSQPKQAARTESSSRVAAEPAPKASSQAMVHPVARSSKGTQGELVRRFVDDQRDIWTSPAHLRFSDTEWLVPVGGFAAGLFVTDRDVSRHLSQNPTTLSHYKTLSDVSVGALIGAGAGMWLLGHASHNEHWRETGFLAGEAAVNSLMAVETLKYSLRRQRPFQGDGSGNFFQGGGTSFPSEHAAAAWAVAGVIAHEYPGPLTKIMAYGLASAVSFSRVHARQHFSSDVFIGGLIGDLIAQHIYSKRHDPDLGGGEWRSIGEFLRGDGSSSPANQGSPYVPLDSWIYPALDRLAARGLIDSGFAGMRPWTRGECMRQVSEAEEKLADGDKREAEAAGLIKALNREFHSGSEVTDGDGAGTGAFRVESVYSRTEHISGTPLNDGYHFAQTQINDFGRPYGEGFNTVNGFSAYATKGLWVAYVRGELQTAPNVPALSLLARETIQRADILPQLPPGTDKPAVSQFQLLDAYVGLMLSNWQVSFGKQSLWWGPGDGGSMMFSSNAQPINMFRINRVTPIKLPSILGWLGSMRMEFFLGQLAGYEFVYSPLGFNGQFGQSLAKQPLLHGQRISFKPTRNFEFGVSRTTIYGGPGYPFTPHTFLRSLFSTGNEVAGRPSKPGDRRSGFDFSYRLPGLRNWLTFYGDGFTDDQFSPIGYFDRSAWHAGLFLSHFPRLPKLDLRVEGVYTDNPIGGAVSHGFYYFNGTWRSGYTNNGYLIGSWIGREGQGAQAWTNYWFGARNRLQFNFRHQKVSQEFIPGGGTLTDVGVRGDYALRSGLSVSVSIQHERWIFPVVQPNASRNVTTGVEILFEPKKLFQRSAVRAAGTASGTGDRP